MHGTRTLATKIRMAMFAEGHRRRRFQAGEAGLGFLGAACVGTDESTRKQRVYTRNPMCADARAHHPELAVDPRERSSAGVQLDGGQHMRAVVTEADIRDHADHHVLVFDLGLVGFQTFGCQEADSDSGTDVHPVMQGHGYANDRGNDWHQPDQRDTQATTFDFRAWH